jgi:hypothetical protein
MELMFNVAGVVVMNTVVTVMLMADIRQSNAVERGVECALRKKYNSGNRCASIAGVRCIGYRLELRYFAEYLYVCDTPVFLELQMQYFHKIPVCFITVMTSDFMHMGNIFGDKLKMEHLVTELLFIIPAILNTEVSCPLILGICTRTPNWGSGRL